MINYYKIWESINTESRINLTKAIIARKIPTTGMFPVFLATDIRNRIRLLYIGVDESQNIIVDKMPKFMGLDITISELSIGEFYNQYFLILTQSIPNTENIFESVISDICDKIVNLDKKNQLSEVLTKVLNEWKIFFEKQENEVLPISTQKGLVGELYFLKDYLFKKYSFLESLNYWTGPNKTNHDFQINDIAVEIKSTSSKQHKKVIISSENQLDNQGINHLYLMLFSFNLHTNMIENSLPSLINDIDSILHKDVAMMYQFNIKLMKYGYSKKQSKHYTVGFSISDLRSFEVIGEFPRLLKSDIPNGVGDLKYSVAVSACSPFEIKTDILKII